MTTNRSALPAAARIRSAASVVAFSLFALCLTLVSTTASAQTTYTWNQTGTASWAVSTNWTPTRTTPATNDVMVFNNGATTTVTAIPTQTIGQLSVSGNTTVNLQAAVTASTVTISGGAGADLSVALGSQLNINTALALTIALATGTTGTVSGTMTFTAGAHKITATDVSSLTFQNGSAFTSGAGVSGASPFGAVTNSTIFASGSTYNFVAGSTPFPATTFQTGSLFSNQGSGTPSFSGRTYANFEQKTASTTTVTGGTAVVMDNLTITQGTLNFNMTATPGHTINGNISVASGAVLNFNPLTAGTVNVKGNITNAGTLGLTPTVTGNVTLNGASAQTLSSSGTLNVGNANETITVGNANGLTLLSPITVNNGTLALTTGTVTASGANTLSIGSAANVTRTSGYVIGNLKKTFAAAASKVFEVGTANGYSPFTANVTAGTFPADVTAVAVQGPQPNMTASTSLQRYWTLTATGITADLTFQYLAGDVQGNEANYQVARVSGGTPTFFPASVVNTSTHVATLAGVSSFSDWTVGEAPDVTPPIVSSVSVPGNGSYAAGQNLDFTVNFSEIVNVSTGGGTPRIPITLNTPGTVHATYVSGSGTTALLFRYTVAGGDNDPDGITVGSAFETNGGTIKDAAGNDAITTLNNVASTTGVLVDTTAPTVQSITRVNASPTALSNVDYTVTFSEAVTNVDSGDFTVTATGVTGAAVTNVTGSGATRTVTVSTGTGASGTVRLDVVASPTINDLAGNAETSGFTTGDVYTIDRTAPSVSSVTRVTASPTNAAAVSFTVTFSSDVTGVDSTDFQLTTTGVTGASVTTVTPVNAAVYAVSVNSGSGDGTIRLDVLNNGSIQSPTSVPLAGGTFTGGEVYSIDKTAPTVLSIARVDANPTNAASVHFTVTFSESVTGVSTSTFAAAASDLTGASISGVTGSGTTYTVTAATGSGDGTLGVNAVADAAVHDTAGNAFATPFTGAVYTIDKTAPAVQAILKASSDPSSAATVDFTVTFSEAVTGVDSADFTITAPGIAGTSIANVTGSGTAYTVTVNTGTGNASLRLDLTGNGTVVDSAGNSAVTFTGGESYTMQGTPATPTGLVATPGNAHVALAWNTAAGATTYNVKRGTVSGGPYTTLNSTVATTSYDDLTAVNGTPYFYVVSANGTRGPGGNSNEAPATPAAPAANTFGLVLSQIYGGGGNAGATLKNDFIEVFNKGSQTVNLTGWSVQYSSATGTTWQVTTLSGTIAPGHYYLVQEAAGTGGTLSLPTPDATGAINMSATAGKVALVDTTSALSGACPTGTTIADFVGFGSTANCFEGSGPTPALTPTNTASALRADGGCTDTNNNAADFAAAAASPRNSASPTHDCSGFAVAGSANPASVDQGATTLFTATVTPGAGPASTGIAVTANLTAIGGSPTQTLFDDGTNGDVTLGDNIFSYSATVAPATSTGSASISVTATDAQSRSTSTTIPLFVNPSTLSTIAQAKVDGNNDTVPDLLGQTVKIQGVVTSINFRTTTGIEYYIQDATGGIDVFNATTSFGPFSIGANVEVIGAIAQFNGLTEITPHSITTVTGLPSVTAQTVTLSQLADGAGEPLEGKLVTVNNVTITSGSFSALGVSGNVTISDGTGSGTMRINAATDIDGTTAPAGAFTLTGVVSQSDTTNPFDCCYQVLPRALTDITAQTAPAGTGSANPSSVAVNATTLLTVTTSPGQNPTSTGIAVSANLSSIGGSANQAFFDNGTNGDVTAGDGVFSFSTTIGNATTLGGKTLPFTVSDAQSRSSNGNITLTVQSANAPPAPAGLGATAGNLQVALIWNASAGATDYNVYRATVAGGPYTTTVATSVPVTNYTDTTVSNGTRYYYVVTASNATDESGPSNEANALPAAPPPAGALGKVYFIDIGQGASTLIVSPTGKTLLVDGGPETSPVSGQGQGLFKVIPLLNTLGIATIDYTVLTHYHIDHDAGLAEVINAGRVAGTAYDNGDDPTLIPPTFSTSPASTYGHYATYVAAINAHSGTVTRAVATPGTVIDLGGGMRATIMAQGGHLLSGGQVTIDNSDLNTESISVFVEYNNFDFLVSGDLTGGGSTDTAKTPDVETYVAQMVGDIDVLEFDHHGSTTANGRRFLKLLKAEVAEAEAGFTNTFGHPNRETFNKFLNTPDTNGNTYTGTALPDPGNGPVAYQTDPSPTSDDRCTRQGYSGASTSNVGNGTLLLKTDGTTSYTIESFDDGGVRIPANAHVYALDATGAGVTTNFPPTVQTSVTPVVPLSSETATVNAAVFDREDAISSVTLNYALDGISQAPVTMSFSGGVYTATIAAQPDGTRVNYTVTAVAGGQSTSFSTGYFSGTTPISTLRVNDPLGSPLYWDYAARVQGVVTSGTGNFGTGTNDDYLQDATGAINVWRTIQPTVPAVQTTTAGNVYSVVGLIGESGGRLRLEVTPPFVSPTTPYQITLVSSGSVPAPLLKTIAQLNANPESLEAQLITINNCHVTSGAIPASPASIDGFLTISDGTGSFQLKIDHNTDIPGMATPSGTFAVTGILQQDDFLRPFDSNYDMAPRSRVDLGGTSNTGPGLISIADARIDVDASGNSPGDYVPDLLNQTVHIQGAVTSINFRTSNGSGIEYYVQDPSGGVDIFSTATTRSFSIGDDLDIIGTVKQFNALTEIDPGATVTNLTVLAPGTLPAVTPQVVTLSQIGDSGAGELLEGRLIRINNVTLTAPPATFAGATNYAISDSTGSCTACFRISASANLVGQAPPSGTFSVVGVLGQFDSAAPFDSGYQLFPRSTADLQAAVATPASIAATGGTPQSAPINTAFASPLAATVKDGSSNGIGFVNVTFTAPGSGASGTFAGGGTSTIVATDATGVATAPAFTANNIDGTYNVTATINALPASFSLTNIAPAATHISVTAPANANFGSAFNITVSALDVSNALVVGYTGTVHFSSGSAGSMPSDYTFTAGDAGTHTFSATLTSAGSQTIDVDDVANSLNGSATVIVAPPPATHFSVTAPANVINGVAFNVTVTALDASNATVSSYTGTAHFTSSSAGTLPSDFTFSGGDSGTHTFSVTLTTNGAQSITVGDGSISGSANTTVALPAATHFSVTAPANVTSGVAFNATVTALDASNATVPSYTGTVHFTSSSTGTLPGDYTFTGGDAGAHTFSVTLTSIGSKTITATDTSSAITGTANTTVVAAPATHLSVTAPGTMAPGIPFNVTVTALDASNAIVTGYAGTVHFISSSAGTLPADYTFTGGDSGTHTFSVTLTSPGSQTITATDTVTASITGSASTMGICPPLTILATATNSGPACAGGSVNLFSSGGGAGATFSWTGPGGFTSNQQNPTGITVAGTYTVTVNGPGPCIGSGQASTTVVINPNPVATIANGGTACTLSPGNVASVADAGAGATYLWSITNGAITSGVGTRSITYTAGSSGSVHLAITVTASGCSANGSADVTINNGPTISLPSALSSCGPAVLTVAYTLTGNGPWTIHWSDGITQSGVATSSSSRLFSATVATVLSVVSVSDASCTSAGPVDGVHITIASTPAITTQPAGQIVSPGSQATFTVVATGANLHYQWFVKHPSGTTNPVGTDASSFTTHPEGNAFWFVRITNTCGTIDSDEVNAQVETPRHHPSH